jgi:hypothetical protein
MLIFSKYLNPMFLFASDSFKYTELAVITKMKEATHTLLDSFFLQLEEVGSQEMLRDMRTYALIPLSLLPKSWGCKHNNRSHKRCQPY